MIHLTTSSYPLVQIRLDISDRLAQAVSVAQEYHVPSDQYVGRVEAPRPVTKIHRQY